jgi:hypothetical protein
MQLMIRQWTVDGSPAKQIMAQVGWYKREDLREFDLGRGFYEDLQAHGCESRYFLRSRDGGEDDREDIGAPSGQIILRG